ncbi:MAG: Stp1/IreP family PP2C-type Ser/Thr phosphatase [Anaerovoracaceae bacterium]|nr:Stp1/IreP family PP2C-type Ser/Thr phosphatase [Bacillota bacterium]MDY2670088.1 Stp1/IreP family PP2C-type Ser/Thr phosphatase [Anaerovoracaceae bacterium]
MYEFGFRCDTGRVRDINQDAFFVIPEKGVFLIADGVGGHNNGELASRTAMTDIAEYIKENPIPVELGAEELKNYFVSLVFAVNRHIYNIARESAPEGMATTLVILFISGGKAYVVNVGDSRLYLLRDENMIQVTEDHTYVNGLVKKGIIDEEQARTHPDRNMITRAVGAEHDVEPDLFLFDVYGGDIILMCTDGLYNELSDSEMHDMVLNSRDMRTACSELVDEANRRGGTDNITAVSVRI